MSIITIEVPDELSGQLTQMGDRLPELLAQFLQQPTIPVHIYRYILNFLASTPTPEEIADFKPTPEMQDRLQTLLSRSKMGQLTPAEHQELDEYEQIEHLIIMLKAGNLHYLNPVNE
ncbi:hypothetical protein NG796_06200 [Laspinema sp. A4]|uniref:hypothetical protein n=1 Tax=Laspinema sp. D2d TaxID=2953686 RepID=UPI0021BB617E|nr:hypothetical protein [Laspinema sp. D2d]MCT7982880.1 hypothetical protein [Laspinema sp. D2d]